MIGLLGDVVVTRCPPDLDVRAVRAALLEDPAVAYAAAPPDARRPGIAGLGRGLLASMGRPGVTWGRRAGEQHFLRPLPYWRADAITDLVVLDAQQLRIGGLTVLLDAASAAPLRTWLLLTDPARPAVTTWLADAHAVATPWADVVAHWRVRLSAQAGRRDRCPTAAHPPWTGTDPVGVHAWTAEPPPCPVHERAAGCLREALRGAHARGELTATEACETARQHALTLERDGDRDGALAAAVLLGRDVYAPARATLGRLGASAQVRLRQVDADGAVRGSTRKPDAIEAAALRAMRAQDALAGCAGSGPFLTILGEPTG
jgi:hypothetical protein